MKHDWEYKKLGDISKIASGKSIEARHIKSEYHEGLYYCYGGNGVRGFVDKFSYEGMYPIIGRVGALCGNVHLAEGRFYATEHALVVRILQNTNPYWLTFQLKALNLRSIAKGVAQPVISAKEVSSISIPVPPLPVQQQIVDELDKLSEIIEKKKQQVKELDNLAQSIFYDMFGEILEATPTKSLKDVAEYFIGLTYKPSDVSENGYIVLRSSNIQNNILDFNDTVRVNVKINEKKFVQEGDILMCARNGSAKLVGKVARISNLQEQMSFGAFMTIIRSQYNDYLFHFFLSHFFRGQLTTSKTATINQITTKMLDGIKLNIPTIELQQTFAQKIEAIEKQKELIYQSIKETQTLFDSRMDYYFGE